MAFNIPGARLLEEVLAGLPTNSAQAIKLREFAAQIEVLTKERDELKAKVAALQPKSAMEPDAAKILKVFFDRPNTLTAHDVAKILQMKLGVVQYHFDKLVTDDFLRETTGYSGYDIQAAGRDFIVKNGMA